MITADHHNPRAGIAHPGERFVEQPHGRDRWDGPVVHVPSDDNEVDLLDTDNLDEVVDERGLGRRQIEPVQGAAEMPVGCVQREHAMHGKARLRRFHTRVPDGGPPVPAAAGSAPRRGRRAPGDRGVDQ